MAAAQPLKIRMVAGLGNPGEEYAETRHNAGFKAIDELARQAGVTYWKNQAGAEVALININDPEEEGGKRQIDRRRRGCPKCERRSPRASWDAGAQ